MDILDKIEIMITEVKIRKVIRGGKIVKKVFCPPGFKAVKKRCVKMSATERRKRSIATKRSQRKIQAGAAGAKAIRKRAKSMRKKQGLIPTATPSGDV